MLSRKTLVGGLAFVLLAVLALVLVGGSGVRSEEETGAATDFQIDLSRLGESCQYWAPSPPSGGEPGPSRQHSGLKPEVIVADPSAVTLQHACTDQPTCEWGAAAHDLDCFLGGEHYIQMGVENPMDGCIAFTVKGLRGAAANVRVDGVKQSFQYLARKSGGVDTICGLQAGQQVVLRLMMCPTSRGESVDLFWSILGTARLFGTVEGDPNWDYTFDHNEDDEIDLFDDIFAVAHRFGLECDDFDY